MSEIVSFKPRTEALEDNGPYIVGQAFCSACGHEWSGLADVGVVHLECPKCRRYWGAFKHAIEPDMAWRCDCGQELFWITPKGVMCRKCGKLQVDWF